MPVAGWGHGAQESRTVNSIAPLAMNLFRSLLALLAAAVSAGCVSLPAANHNASTVAGQALLDAAARAHGWESYRTLKDISLRHEGQWFDLVARMQPVLVDRDYRVRAEERILVGQRESAKSYSGGVGPKHAYRNPDELALFYNGKPEPSAEKRDAAALVLDVYLLFLLGPLFLKEQDAIVDAVGTDRVDGVPVDVLVARMRPGFGFAPEDKVVAYIGRDDRLVRRIRFSIEGLASTRGAVIEVDYFDYIERDGVRFPTRWFERVKRPVLISARDWRMTGLDLDRGFSRSDIKGPQLLGAAAAPAISLK